VKDGIARLQWVTATYNNRGLHRVMSEAVYAGHESWEFYRRPVYLSLAFFVLALFVAVPKDRKRRLIWKHGRRLRGPELVTTAEFNEKLGKSKLMRVELPGRNRAHQRRADVVDKLISFDLPSFSLNSAVVTSSGPRNLRP